LFLVGVDTLKAALLDRLTRGSGLRFSHTLEAAYFEQVASERKVIRYQRGQPVRRFERIPGRRAEALDCLVYAHAARAGLQISLDVREAELRADAPPSAPPVVVRSSFVEAW
jgi:phage terminase large subunit GpA-like protein